MSRVSYLFKSPAACASLTAEGLAGFFVPEVDCRKTDPIELAAFAQACRVLSPGSFLSSLKKVELKAFVVRCVALLADDCVGVVMRIGCRDAVGHLRTIKPEVRFLVPCS